MQTAYILYTIEYTQTAKYIILKFNTMHIIQCFFFSNTNIISLTSIINLLVFLVGFTFQKYSQKLDISYYLVQVV